MINIKDITKPINGDLIKFNDVLRTSTRSDVDLINVVINYILKNKGKQLRPILCLLSARVCSKPNDLSITAASARIDEISLIIISANLIY